MLQKCHRSPPRTLILILIKLRTGPSHILYTNPCAAHPPCPVPPWHSLMEPEVPAALQALLSPFPSGSPAKDITIPGFNHQTLSPCHQPATTPRSPGERSSAEFTHPRCSGREKSQPRRLPREQGSTSWWIFNRSWSALDLQQVFHSCKQIL